ncbi:MAG: hypothetical protein KBD78_01225 [Oligoflexales bacterium]|nr:hypothetical protein [Oligoflexales bacterium]
MKNFLNLIIFSLILCGEIFAQNTSIQTSPPIKIEQVGGTYKIEAINKYVGGVKVIFVSSSSADKYQRLILDTQHIHIGLDVGDELRISSEVESINKSTINIRQVLVFLPAVESHTPVWLTSKNLLVPDFFSNKNILKMHVPQSDYLIF